MTDRSRPDDPSTADVLGRALGAGARHVAGVLARLRAGGPTHVAGYRGYATATRALVLARALTGAPPAPADAAHGAWRNLREALRRIESDPIPHATLDGRLGAQRFRATADDEGFVRHWVPLPAPLAPGGWHRVTLALPDAGSAGLAEPAPAGAQAAPAEHASAGPFGIAEAAVLAPARGARFLVISDLDDTVLQSDATRLLRAARLLLLENARTRLPFPGVAALYRALVNGATGDEGNPVFYVSSSPWNLYDVVADFLDVRGIPAGPLLLRDWDLGRGLGTHGGHKRAAIAEILDGFPSLPVLLIGDSGQEDPEIYRAVARDWPGRVLGVVIRNVTRTPARIAAVQALADELRSSGTTLLLADDSAAIAAHAAERGWIARDAVTTVREASEADEARPRVD